MYKQRNLLHFNFNEMYAAVTRDKKCNVGTLIPTENVPTHLTY